MRKHIASLLLALAVIDNAIAPARLPALRTRLPIKRAFRLKRPARRFGVRADGRIGLFTLEHT